uniref:Uncharacterized protein n=1 Tax=Arundo donax TaxID=35708 RepID=A0A0A9EI13_ARUDO
MQKRRVDVAQKCSRFRYSFACDQVTLVCSFMLVNDGLGSQLYCG